jgi:hypothetical protein
MRNLAAASAALLMGLSGCWLQPIPKQEASTETTVATTGVATAKTMGLRDGAYPVYTFYDEDYPQGAFTYTYGGSTKITQQSGVGGLGSEYFIHYNLDQHDYSGAALDLWNQTFDLVPYRKAGALVLQVRGLNGNERIKFALGDNEKVVVHVESSNYGEIKKGEWTTFVVPLSDFGTRGVFWNAQTQSEDPKPFNWSKVVEFRVYSNLADNKEGVVDIDNVQFWGDAIDPTVAPPIDDWLAMDKSSDAPTPEQLKLKDEIAANFFIDDVPAFSYVYGGTKTAVKPLESTTPGNAQVLGCYLENDYSGITLSIGNKKYFDLTPYRKTGTLTFWVKGGKASSRFIIGLLDRQDAAGLVKVQTKLVANDYVEGLVEENKWVQVRVPLKKFPDDGTYWDAGKGREISKKIDWSKIQEIRLSIGRDENKPGAGRPVVFYLDQIQVTKTAIGVRDDEAVWNAFKSDAKDVTLFDFSNTKSNELWQAMHGQTADLSRTFVTANVPGKFTGKAMKIDFKPGDWFDDAFQLPKDPTVETNWTKHWGLSMWIYTDKPYQQFDVTLYDAEHECFIATVGSVRGWNQVILPFKDFSKYPYYQPPEARQNNRLDLDGVFQMSFKPGGDVPGSFMVKSIALTNQREVVRQKGAALENAEATGDLTKVIKPIGDIYGINVGLWAPELMDAPSIELEKPMHLGTVRYPGGLRSDEDHWEQILKAKDFHVDTDEFLDWCLKVGVEPMFTANVGCGTPEENARWVEYVNKKRAGPKVKYWEIGNEVYGNWHKYYDQWGKDGGVAYGKRAREIILAMKKVDPTIKVTVVWQLTGDWNKTVLKEVADVVDGINVHHYAQKTGSENDQALLAVSGSAKDIMEDVREQVKKFGLPGKKYETWLTEWNSVDFNPGPQILSHINSIFIGDYLGHLAESSLDRANLWALYNGRDKRNGDYGVLASAADQQGLNKTRPSYWAMRMMANTLSGQLLKSGTDKEDLMFWMSKKADGKTGIVFVNKSPDSEYKTKLKIPGLKGKATIQTLVESNSYDGPTTKTIDVSEGTEISVPKYSLVTINVD